MNSRLAVVAAVFALILPVASAAASQNPADLPAGRYALDRKHASVTAKVMHLGVSLYTMRFDTFDGSFTYDPAHPEAAQVRANVDATSLDVGAGYGRKFADEFLDASRFPVVSFVSNQIRPAPDGRTGAMTGDLTLHGVTKPATFDVTFDGVGHGLLGGTVTGFTATAKIKRSDFGSTALQNWVGDDVTITIEAEFDKR
jgi:polyisoprenoid-binding protein YceI